MNLAQPSCMKNPPDRRVFLYRFNQLDVQQFGHGC